MNDCPIISWKEFDFRRFALLPPEKRKTANPGTKQTRRYLDIVTAFDIETSKLPGMDEAGMYVWQWQFSDWCTVMGRTWDEWRQFVKILLEFISEKQSLVVLVHSLAFEFQFLRTVYRFAPDEVFAVKSRKVLKCTMYDRRLEFRCSYLHSNMSLAAYTKKMGVAHQKLSGEEFDYSKTRYPWTPLTERELQYCQNDVLGLVEAYTEELRRDRDTLQTIPLTSTGYVRRDAKRAMRVASRSMIPDMQPDLEQYRLLRDTFRGGDTHANRYYVGKILHNVHSADRSSSYPDVICNQQFPMTRFRWIDDPNIRNIRYHVKRKHAVAMRIALWDVKMRDPYDGFPYLSRSKCFNVVDPIEDNGRILEATYLEVCLTDVDFEIVSRQYKWAHIKGVKAMWAHYGYLPRPLVLCAIEYYTNKTKLKGITSEDGSAEYLYARSKELLNALYGMMAQDPLKYDILFEEGAEEVFNIRFSDPEEKLKAYQRRAFLVYQWGVWVTAHARKALRDGIACCEDAGHKAIYVDTDSVKYLSNADFSEFNRLREEASIESGAHATDPNGVEHFMGVYEQESDYAEYCTLGSKKYAYRYPDGKLGITVAGVGKRAGAKELEAAGGLPAFKNGFVFVEGGGVEAVYNDEPGSRWLPFDGGVWEIGPNIYLKPSTYTMGQTADYIRLLQDPEFFATLKQRRQ